MTGSGTKSVNEGGLRPASYQLVPLAKVLVNHLNAVLVADGVGTGKTISAGYIIRYAMSKFSGPCLVICSPTLLPKWTLELKSKFAITTSPIRSVEDLETAKDESVHRTGARDKPVYIMSNSLLYRAKKDSYPELSSVVFDEIHTYRNVEARWHQGCKNVAGTAVIRVGLTATPINNSLDDLSGELAILLPKYSNEAVFASVSELWTSHRQALTNTLCTRFLKERLGIHFAKRVVHSSSISYPDSYVRKVRQAIKQRSSGDSILEQITYYRLAASSPRAFWSSVGVKDVSEQSDPKLEALVRVLSEKEVTHWLVFCEFVGTVDSLLEKLVVPDVEVYTMTGETPIFEREAIVESFRNTSKGILIMTSVGSEGLDLQFCEGIVNYDLHWNPMRLEQRIGRIDRVGQQKDHVRIVNIHVANSIDSRVLSVINKKLEIIANSVFAPSEIVSAIPGTREPFGLYSEEAIAQEVAAGSSLIESLKMNQSIESIDYGALSSVNLSFCDPSVLRKEAERLQPQSIVAAKDWIKRMEGDSTKCQQTLKYYS